MVHDNTLNFDGMSYHMSNHYELDNILSGRLIFSYESYGDRLGDNKSKFLSGDRIIEYHWIK